MVQRKKVAKKKAVAQTANTDRLVRLKAQVADLKAENKALKQMMRQKERQITALLKALETTEQRVARFLRREQKELLKQYDLLTRPKRRRGRPPKNPEAS